jgi:uncharacterized small protein (DUF1192 family)
MDLNEDRPKAKPVVAVGENLETLGVIELEQRIRDLEAEIIRTRADIDKKQASKRAADSFFKS